MVIASASNGPIQIGATSAVMSRWDRECAAMQIERARVTGFTAITTMIVDFLANPNLPKYDLSSLDYLGGGGAAMPEAVAKKLNDTLGLEFLEGYGLSETMAPSHSNPPQRPKRQCGGIPIFDVSKILGHATVKMTMRYAHFAPEAGRAAAERLGDHMAKIKAA